MFAAAYLSDAVSSMWSTTLLTLAVPLLGGLAAAVGAIAWARIRRSGGKLRGAPLAVSALVMGCLLVVASPFLLAATLRANLARDFSTPPQSRTGAEAQRAEAETASPATSGLPAANQGQPLSFGWVDAVKGMGLFGVLIVLVGLCMLASTAVGVFSDKIVWLPVAGGVLGLVLGVVGTVIGMVTAFSTVSELGGAANPADLSQGIGMSLITTFMGAAMLLFGVASTAGLAVFHGYRREAAATR